MLRDTRGNVIVTFAIALPVLVLAMGAALGFGNAWLTKYKLGRMADAAALAAAALPAPEQAAAAQAFVDANNEVGVPVTVAVSSTGTSVTVDLSATMPPMLGTPSLPVGVTATAQRLAKAEVALVIDVSAHAADVLDQVKIEALDLVNRIKGPDVKIAVVPFAGAVNVGTQYSNAAWLIQGFGQSGMRQGDWQTAPPTIPNLDLFKGLQTATGDPVSWGGCVEARVNNDVNNLAPTGNARFVAYFAPDAPDPWTCDSNTGNCHVVGGKALGTKSTGGVNQYLADAGGIPAISALQNNVCRNAWRQIQGVSGQLFNLQQPIPPFKESPAATSPPIAFVSGSVTCSPSLSQNASYLAVVTPGLDPLQRPFTHSVNNGSTLFNCNGLSGIVRYSLLDFWSDSTGTLALGGTNVGTSTEDKLCKYGRETGDKAVVANVTVDATLAGLPSTVTMAGGPNFNCPASSNALLPLTLSTSSAITDKIAALTAGGSADIAEGVAWGWHLLDQTWTGQGEPFRGEAVAADKQKIIVVISTGAQSLPDAPGKFTKSDYSARGYLSTARHFGGATSAAAGPMNLRLIALCNAAKAAGIKIRTVLVGSGDGSALASCASPEGFVTGIDEIEGVGIELTDVVLVQ